ncbi:MAG: 3-phosphoshikimate 1-carboxyvinyltransferase [Clostridia bacterium]|nr:3-phosphoshikimate 1-carboxyvinyltransferase [Clostridia bacterium]
MQVIVAPSVGRGSIVAPPSKSAAHRGLIAAALSEGCRIYGLGNSADMDATCRALIALGAQLREESGSLYAGGLRPQECKPCHIDCGESGSTLRFIIPLCLIGGQPITLSGQGRLMERPLEEYRQLCQEKGFAFELAGNTLTVCGALKGGEYRVSGARSSQFITGMMLALPMLDGDSRLIIEGQAQSRSYIDLTEQILKEFGIRLTKTDDGYIIPGGQHYRAERFCVEADWSNAAFPEALNVLGGDVTVTGLREASTQGDKIYRKYFGLLGTEQQMDLSDCPDLAPILFALAAVKGGRFVGCKRLRLKESDRIAAMHSELKKCGVTLAADEDSVVISPDGLCPPKETICSHGDHRIVMAMTVLLTRLGGRIEGAEAVGKSWRDFFEAMKLLDIEVIQC